MQLTRQILTDLVRTLEKSEVVQDSATRRALRLAQNHLTETNSNSAGEVLERGVVLTYRQADDTGWPVGTKLYP